MDIKEIYEYQETPRDTIMEETDNQLGMVCEEVVIDNGVFLKIKGHPYPYKGIPTPEAIHAFNVVKKILIESLKIASHPTSWVYMIFCLFTYKSTIKRLIPAFNRVTWPLVIPCIIKYGYMTPASQYIQTSVKNFLFIFGINIWDSMVTSQIIAHIFEYDAAYRLRFQDMMSETSPSRLIEHPIRELLRLRKILSSREVAKNVAYKYSLGIYALIVLLCIPRIRVLFKLVVNDSQFFYKSQLDDNDKYWCSLKTDYDYMGKTLKKKPL